MSNQPSFQPAPYAIPNHLLAKKLSSVNSKLDAFSRELGEESPLNVLINTPITVKNKKIMADYLPETLKQMETIQQRLSNMMTTIVDINETLLKYQDTEQMTVANMNNEIHHKRSVQQLGTHLYSSSIN